MQNDDGGWGDTPGSPSSSDGTGAAMQALAGSQAAQHALNFLRNGQRTNGGFPLGESFPVNTQSTAWAVQGIIATGGNPSSFKPAGKTPFDYLAINQQPDGHYRYAIPGNGTSSLVANQSPVWTTAQVLAAVTETPFPIADVPAAKPPKSPPPTSTTPPTPSTPPITPPSSSSPSGGLPPGVLPELPPESSGSSPPAASGGGNPGSPGEGVAPSQVVPSGPGESETPPGADGGAAPPADSSGPGDEPLRTTEPENADDDGGGSSGVAVSILTGLLAGCLLFGLAWAARRGWMHWRYGL